MRRPSTPRRSAKQTTVASAVCCVLCAVCCVLCVVCFVLALCSALRQRRPIGSALGPYLARDPCRLCLLPPRWTNGCELIAQVSRLRSAVCLSSQVVDLFRLFAETVEFFVKMDLAWEDCFLQVRERTTSDIVGPPICNHGLW